MDSLKFFPGPPCPTLLPLKRLYGRFRGGPPARWTACGLRPSSNPSNTPRRTPISRVDGTQFWLPTFQFEDLLVSWRDHGCQVFNFGSLFFYFGVKFLDDPLEGRDLRLHLFFFAFVFGADSLGKGLGKREGLRRRDVCERRTDQLKVAAMIRQTLNG
jgi:hypothetical protein